LTTEQFDTYLQGSSLEGHGKDFEAVDKYINGAFICALAVHESGWGTSELAREKNNLFGYGAYDESLQSAWKFKDWSSCIRSVAVYILRDYLTEGGEYHTGYRVEDIGKQYATDPGWAEKVKAITEEICDTE
jgi:beta-N-acetylglucosaminidase